MIGRRELFRAKQAAENVAYTGTAGNSTACPSECKIVRIVCTTDAHIRIGVAATAVATDQFCQAKTEYFFGIDGGERVSAIQDAAGGNCNVCFGTV